MKKLEMENKKAILLENGAILDIPQSLITSLKRRNIEWEYYDMTERFWPENREETVKFFSDLPKEQLIVCNTVFEDYQQLELMVELFSKLKSKKFTLMIQHPSLADSFLEYFNQFESDITPRSDRYNNSLKLRKGFKEKMNFKFLEVLNYHNVIWIKRYSDEEIRLKTLEDIKNNLYDKS